MTTTMTTEPRRPRVPQPDLGDALRARTLPRAAVTALHLTAVALAVVGALGLVGGIRTVLLAVVVALVVPAWALAVEGRRRATDRFVTVLVAGAFGLALVPLVSILWTVLANGLSAVSTEFLTYSMRNVVGEGGGVYHAMIGTLLITLSATLISVPIGLFTAIYLVEYGDDGKLATWVRFLVDVMTGIPSIVAGLFAYALFVMIFGPGVRMGVGGAVALAVLMIPIVVRSAEEMLKLVPNELREASYALGVPKWRTVVKVVLPTALAGLVTGVTLAIARVIGETAPLLVIAGATDSVNFNLFEGRMATLPVFTYNSIMQPGVPPEPAIARAWGAALLLMVIVMVLNIVARLVSRHFSPKGER